MPKVPAPALPPVPAMSDLPSPCMTTPAVLLIPTRASFLLNGKPAVYIQQGQSFNTRNIQVGRRSDEDIVVTGGLKEGELVTLESPADAAKRARKKL